MKIYLKWALTVVSPWRLEKTPCRRPKMPPKRVPGASRMPPNRVQDASKPRESRQDGLRSLKDMGKTLHDASQTSQQASKSHPRRLWDDPKRVQNPLASSENQLCRDRLKINYVKRLIHRTQTKKTNLHEVDSSDTNAKDSSTPIWTLQNPALGTHALTVLTWCFFHNDDSAAPTSKGRRIGVSP